MKLRQTKLKLLKFRFPLIMSRVIRQKSTYDYSNG